MEIGGSSVSTEEGPAVEVWGSEDPCGRTAIKIGSVQGTGDSTPFSNTSKTVRGIVTAVFPRLSG